LATNQKITPMKNICGNIVNNNATFLLFMAIQYFIVPRVCSCCNIKEHLAMNDNITSTQHDCGDTINYITTILSFMAI
jgi:MinD superfamily P-loop ATPase